MEDGFAFEEVDIPEPTKHVDKVEEDSAMSGSNGNGSNADELKKQRARILKVTEHILGAYCVKE